MIAKRRKKEEILVGKVMLLKARKNHQVVKKIKMVKLKWSTTVLKRKNDKR